MLGDLSLQLLDHSLDLGPLLRALVDASLDARLHALALHQQQQLLLQRVDAQLAQLVAHVQLELLVAQLAVADVEDRLDVLQGVVWGICM